MMKFIRHEGSEHTETYNTINKKIKKYYILSHLNSSNIVILQNS